MKKIFAVLLVLCITCVALIACQPKENITADEAIEVVMDELKNVADKVSPPHVHEGTYHGEACYNVYVTVGDASLVYVVSMSGKVLHTGSGAHSH